MERSKKNADETPYNMNSIISAFSQLLTVTSDKDLLYKKYDLKPKTKVVWLDGYEDLGGGNYNLIFKSAKYQQSRVVRDTETMVSRGILKKPEDGDEEMTHLCVRFRKDSDRLVAACEFNYYGISTSDIASYLNDQFNQLQETTGEPYLYQISFTPLPSADFLTELSKMRTRSVLRLTMELENLSNGDFQRLAGRGDLRPTVEVYLKKKRGKGNNISQQIIEELYKDTGSTKKIKKISVEGANQSGCLKIDSESIQMQHRIKVETHPTTNEVNTNDFFCKVDIFIKEMGV
ncbi:MAG: hypothetical protein RR413_08475 [Christensenellaceae bacterium]